MKHKFSHQCFEFLTLFPHLFYFSNEIILRQGQLDKLYRGLKEIALERRTKLEEALQLFALNREVDDVMQWIDEKEVMAGSQELGQDYEHVSVGIYK